ncbi:uncharacterized protein [Amphiura filiformis]|uniref:uncharacterized protein n=1 Tax=Amphiura filiformis TaxID=82378 RepID=UPI003B225DA6
MLATFDTVPIANDFDDDASEASDVSDASILPTTPSNPGTITKTNDHFDKSLPSTSSASNALPPISAIFGESSQPLIKNSLKKKKKDRQNSRVEKRRRVACDDEEENVKEKISPVDQELLQMARQEHEMKMKIHEVTLQILEMKKKELIKKTIHMISDDDEIEELAPMHGEIYPKY